MLDHNQILNILRTIKDPQSGIDLVQARRIEDFVVEGNTVNFSLVFGKDNALAKSELNFHCIQQIQKQFPEAVVNIHIKQKSSEPAEDLGPLPQIKNIIAVGSGKGGVGKSTVSVNLAKALSMAGYKVGILDADVYGPSIPTMLGLQGQRPKLEILYGKHKLIPLQAHGLHVMSVGFIVEEEQAVVLRGPRLGGIIRQFIQDCLWTDLDYLIVDLPPGTGDVQLTLVQTIPVTGAVMVTTPQTVSLIDAVKAMNMFLLPSVNVPILGVIENMSWFTPAELPSNKYYLFGKGGGQLLSDKSGAPLFGQLPLVQSIREHSDSGSPFVSDDKHPAADTIKHIAQQLEESVARRNRNKPRTKVVQVTQ